MNVTANDITLTTNANFRDNERVVLPLRQSHYLMGDLHISKENPKGNRDFRWMVILGTFDIIYLICTIVLLALNYWEWGFVFLGFHVVETSIVVILETFQLESYYQLESIVSQMKADAPKIILKKVNKHSSKLKTSCWEDEVQQVFKEEVLGVDEWKNNKDDYFELDQIKKGLYAYLEIEL